VCLVLTRDSSGGGWTCCTPLGAPTGGGWAEGRAFAIGLTSGRSWSVGPSGGFCGPAVPARGPVGTPGGAGRQSPRLRNAPAAAAGRAGRNAGGGLLNREGAAHDLTRLARFRHGRLGWDGFWCLVFWFLLARGKG